MDTAAAVTYADLRFNEIPVQDIKLDDDADQSEVTYENVIRTPRDKDPPRAPPAGTTWPQHLKTRLQLWAPLLSLLLLFFSLFLLVAAVVMTVQYISVSRDLQLTSADHTELNRTLSYKLQDRDDNLLSMREELEKSQEELKRSQEEQKRSQEQLKSYQEEQNRNQEKLKRSQEELKRSQEDLEKKTREASDLTFSIQQANSKVKDLQKRSDRAIEEQQKVQTTLNSIQKELCPGEWTYFGRRCFLSSDISRNWNECKDFCEENKATLLVVTGKDIELKNFLAAQQTDYWVGKKPTGKRNPKWDWPSGYYLSSYGTCGKVTAGKLGRADCDYSKKCMCELSLVPVQRLSESSPRTSEIVLWENKYKCEMER